MSMHQTPGEPGPQPAAETDGAARLDAVLLEALRALDERGAGGFFEVMWLGLGDRWTAQRGALRKAGLIDYPKDDPHRPSITPEGRAWLAQGGGTIARGSAGPIEGQRRGRPASGREGGRNASASAGGGHARGAARAPLQPQA